VNTEMIKLTYQLPCCCREEAPSQTKSCTN